MTSSNSHATTEQDLGSDQLETVRALVTAATQQLLGDTISVSDEDWRAASALPGWTRGHVATHIARQADALVRLTEWAQTGQRQEMYADDEQRNSEIEAGAGRSGLEIQIDLDTAAGKLGDSFESLDQANAWDAAVELRGGSQVAARILPLARLNEVVLHHVDLQIGFGIDDIAPKTAEWLLEWCAFRLQTREELPNVKLTSDSGFSINLGDDQATEVTGTSPRLLGWLTGRSPASDVSGADQLTVPAF